MNPATDELKITQRDTLPHGGFAGVRETRIITDHRLFGPRATGSDGLGQCIYLADATFIPHGETGLHGHDNIDILSFMVSGKITHRGTLHDGTSLDGLTIQLQRADSVGLEHNEINPEPSPNRMLQLWLEQERPISRSEYFLYQPIPNQLTAVYGTHPTAHTIPAATRIEVGLFTEGCYLVIDRPFLVYVIYGNATINGKRVQEGSLVRATQAGIEVKPGTYLLVVSVVE